MPAFDPAEGREREGSRFGVGRVRRGASVDPIVEHPLATQQVDDAAAERTGIGDLLFDVGRVEDRRGS